MTKMYGASDDLIEFEGDIDDEVNILSKLGDTEKPFIVSFDDKTKVEVCYNKQGIWEIKLLVVGHLYEKIDKCPTNDADRYSDHLFMKGGLNSYDVEEGRW